METGKFEMLEGFSDEELKKFMKLRKMKDAIPNLKEQIRIVEDIILPEVYKIQNIPVNRNDFRMISGTNENWLKQTVEDHYLRDLHSCLRVMEEELE